MRGKVTTCAKQKLCSVQQIQPESPECGQQRGKIPLVELVDT